MERRAVESENTRETVLAPFLNARNIFSDAISQPSLKVKTNHSIWGRFLSRSLSATASFSVFTRAKFPPVSPLEAQKLSPLLHLLRIRNESSLLVNGVLNLRDDSTRIVGEISPGLHINSWCIMPSVSGREGESDRDNDIIKCSLRPKPLSEHLPPPAVSIQRHKDRHKCSARYNDTDISQGGIPSLFSAPE